jgi:hypothetical protein
MAGGLGMYRNVAVKDGDGVFRVREVLNTSVTLTSTTQQITPVVVPILGDIVGFEYEFAVSVDAASTNPQPIDRAVKEITIQDVKNKPVWDGVSGTDLKYIEYVKGLKGKMQTIPVVTTSEQRVKFVIPHHIDRKDQNVKVGFTVAPYSDLSDDATTGTVKVVVRAIYRDGATTTTARLMKINKAVVSGINNIAPILPKGAFVNEVAIKGDDTKLNSVRFSRDGAEEIEVDKNFLEAYANSRFADGYQAGFFVLPATPFTVNDKVKFDYKANGSDEVSLYLFTSD